MTTTIRDVRPLLFEDRRAGLVVGALLAWLMSIELGTSRLASREAAVSDRAGETVMDTTTSRICDASFVVTLLGGFISSRSGFGMTVRPRRAVFVSGLVALLFSGLLSSAARRHLGRFHRDSLTVHEDHTLVDTGPYQYIRHPLYTATLLSFAGIGAVLGTYLSLALTALPTAALVNRIRVEEPMLVRALGVDYVAYQERTTRLVPRIW